MKPIQSILPEALQDFATRKAFASLLRQTGAWQDKTTALALYDQIRAVIPNQRQFHTYCIESVAISLAPSTQTARAWLRANANEKSDTILD
jgi:hypothetical protein